MESAPAIVSDNIRVLDAQFQVGSDPSIRSTFELSNP
jgi:hypothetical protein